MSNQGIERHRSGRDHTKPSSPQRAQAPAPTSHNLIVCGASGEADGLIFSDFMGYCLAFRAKNVEGRFLSCFPVDEHFAWLERNHPKSTDIKFGKTTNKEKRAVASYSKDQYDRGDHWWEQIPKDQLKDEIIKWISQKASVAVPGDVVYVIIECHGSGKSFTLMVGSNKLLPVELRNLIGKFKDGVQVNMISGACHSGAIVDAFEASGQKSRHVAAACSADEVATTYRSVSNRTRNSRFRQAFCQSLARIQLPGVPQQQQPPKITLGDHEQWMRTMTWRNISPKHANGKQSDTYTSYNEPDELSMLVQAMIFREKADIVFDPAVSASRRRVEYPTINEAIVKHFRNWGPDKPYPFGNNVKSEVELLVQDEKESKIEPKPFKYHGDMFESPLVWLATMMLRGCYDLKQTIETITTSRFLGELDDNAVAEWVQYAQVKDFKIDMNISASQAIGPCEFGFWLPHGIGMVNDEMFAARLRQQVNVFNRIEKTFRDFFNIAPDEIYLESEQGDFFERAPTKMPGWKRSGDWTAAFNLGTSVSTASSARESSRSTAPTSIVSPGR
ncbi:MAG: hypothetical protein Q9170_005879 [Blastenia crenularia]